MFELINDSTFSNIKELLNRNPRPSASEIRNDQMIRAMHFNLTVIVFSDYMHMCSWLNISFWTSPDGHPECLDNPCYMVV